MLVIIANREYPDQTASQKQSDLGLHCLSRPFWQVTSFQNFRTFTILPQFGIQLSYFDIYLFHAYASFQHFCMYLQCKEKNQHIQVTFCLFVCFVALRPKSTAMVMAGWSVHLTTLFPGQA